MSTQKIFCQRCGRPNAAGSQFCNNCGARLATLEEHPTPPPPSRSAQQPPIQPPPAPPQPSPPPHPVYAYPPPIPPQRGRSPWGTCAIVVVALILIGLCVVGIGMLVGGWFVGGPLISVLLGTPMPGGITTSGANSLSVTSGQAGTVTTPGGARLEIPSGAVPPMDDGSQGTMVFSIEEDPSQSVTLPESLSPFGPVYRLGPEGFVFALPVRLTLPIPQDVDPSKIVGMTFYDVPSGVWKLMPAIVDEAARTVSVETTHFSFWGLWGVNDSRDRWYNEHGGWIEVVNRHTRGSSSYPGGRNLPMSTWYGVCIQSYTFDNPQDAWNWVEPRDWKIWASDGATTDFWMPAGQYTLVEFQGRSEINNDPLYVPDYSTVWRPLGTYIIGPGQTERFESSSFDATDSNVTEGEPPCWGEVTTSVGTGDVQVTLTWHAEADIDLYVEDPNGETVWYSNTSISSGGQLDRDNKCSNFVMGRPENIFWPPSGAPAGAYKVSVNYYGDCNGAGAVEWTVRTVVKGQVNTYTGVLNSVGESQDVTTFSLP